MREQVTEHLPPGLREQMRAAIAIDDAISPARWCDQLAAFLQLVDGPERVIGEACAAEPGTLWGSQPATRSLGNGEC